MTGQYARVRVSCRAEANEDFRDAVKEGTALNVQELVQFLAEVASCPKAKFPRAGIRVILGFRACTPGRFFVTV